MASLERGHVPSPRPIAMKEIPLIDRVEEMNVLKEAVYRAVHGQGGVVFVHGEAGIGKTRLARELAAYASLHGMSVLWGRCPALFRMDGVPPYVLWSEVLRDYLEACSPEQLYRVVGFYPGEVAKLVPELRRKLAAIPQSLPISPEHERDRLFEAVFQFIVNVSREAPLMVVLDDLQWTDQTSLLLLHYLARGIYKAPLLILGAYRETDVDEKHPLLPVLTELNRERLLESIQLKRMSLDEVSEMIKQILEQDDVPRDFCELVYEKTRGNPFFLEEVVKSLKEEEVIFRKGNRWEIKEISKIEFPATVKNVVRTRIDRLDDECQNVLTLASFVGNDFSFESLRVTTGVEENRLLELMEKLLKTGLVKEKVIRGEDTYCFADVIVRDVVHEEVSHLRHKKLHESVGNALEKAYAANVDQHLGELAYHFLEAGSKDKALNYFLKAGEKAQEVYAHDEAFSYLQHVVELLEKKKDASGQKAQIVERLGDLKSWIGETDACLKYYAESLTLHDQQEDKKSIAGLHTKMANVLWDAVGDKEKATEHHNSALRILEKEPESVELAKLYENISHMLWRTGETAKAYSFAQKAIRLAEKFGNAEALAECYNDLGIMRQVLEGATGESRKYLEKGLKIAVENNYTDTAIRLYNNLSLAYEAAGETQRAVEMRQNGFELGKKVGDMASGSWIGRTLAWSYVNMGELQSALSLSEDLLALSKRTKNTVGIAQATGLVGSIYGYMGEWEQALQYLREGYDIAMKTGEYQTIVEAAAYLGELYFEMDEYTEAEKRLNESSRTAEKAEDAMYQVYFALTPLARLYLTKKETEKAKELVERICEFAAKTDFKAIIPTVEGLKGMLYREQGNWEQSLQWFERSLAGAKSLNYQKWYALQYAELLCEYGSTFLGRNEEGDRDKGLSLLSQAVDIYRKTGAVKRLEKTKLRMTHAEKTDRVVLRSESAAEILKAVPGRISSGFASLDRLLGGGIPENYTVALTGPSCDEREALVKSFLTTGAKNGEVTIHLTTDPNDTRSLAQEFQSNFYHLVCNPQAGAIAKDSPNVFKLKGVENLTDISIALTSAIRRLDSSHKGPRRICIDLISDVLLQHHAVQTRRWLTALTAELKTAGFTALAVLDPRMHPSEELYAILGLFEGEINIHEKETEKGIEKLLRIKRMSNQEYLEDELPLTRESLRKQR